MMKLLGCCRPPKVSALLSVLHRRFIFSLAAVALLSSKLAHVYCHVSALPALHLLLWGSSFYLQDTLLLLLLYSLLGYSMAATMVVSFFSCVLVVLANIYLNVMVMTGAELEWRNVALASDSGSWGVLAEGLVSGAMILGGLVMTAFVSQALCFAIAAVAADNIKWAVLAVLNRIPACRSLLKRKDIKTGTYGYSQVRQKDVESWNDSESDDEAADAGTVLVRTTAAAKLLYFAVGMSLMTQFLSMLLRPSDSSLIYMSWTLPLMPFIDLGGSYSSFAGTIVSSQETNGTLFNATALRPPLELSWLPKDGTPLAGFEDWYEESKEHYLADADPLKISNLDDSLLSELRNINMRDVSIRHVLLIKLESTRKDVFPVKKSGIAYQRLANLTANHSLTDFGESFVDNLTPTANFLTGDYDNGFDHSNNKKEEKKRGGINANNAHTTSTYTLKSLAGTHCGISPLAADFNQEYWYHIYQPCLPHIFSALNSIDHSEDSSANGPDDFKSHKWKSQFAMSVTKTYDKQDKLMPMLGFLDENIITSEYLRDAPKFGKVDFPDINYFGMQEPILEDYIRDTFVMAKEKNERVFLSHLTSTTHHSFKLPEGEKTVDLTDDEDWTVLSDYLNAIGYVDRWLAKILGILDEQGVADETLVVLVGDHGLSVAERGSYTPYSNPNVGNYHVPLVVSHPKLPAITIDDAVHSAQILPTILDLLIETKSLSESETRAARDLVRNYEGQSLIRPQRKAAPNGIGSWQFTVMNPGGSTIAVRDARQPEWRLIVPFSGHYEWRFTDLSENPFEIKPPTVSFELPSLMKALGAANGTTTDKAKWVEEAAVVVDWWVKENYRRWRYV